MSKAIRPSSVREALVGRLIWEYEQRRPYPLRRKAIALPPIRARVDCSGVLAVLATPSTVDDALWATWSWLRFLHPLLRPMIFVDGPIQLAWRRVIDRLLPGTELHELAAFLAARPRRGPNFHRFTREYRLGLKAALVMQLQDEGPTLYCDADVLAFNRPHEIQTAIESQASLCLYNARTGAGFGNRLRARGLDLGVRSAVDLNSGLMWIPRRALSFELAETLLHNWTPQHPPSWVEEQTLFQVLVGNTAARPLPLERFVVSEQRKQYWQPDVDYQHISTRHFITPVRHLMYLKGLPELWRQATRSR